MHTIAHSSLFKGVNKLVTTKYGAPRTQAPFPKSIQKAGAEKVANSRQDFDGAALLENRFSQMHISRFKENKQSNQA